MHCTRVLPPPTGCSLSMRLMDVKLNRADSRPRGGALPQKTILKASIISSVSPITRLSYCTSTSPSDSCSVVSVASAVGLSQC